MAKRKTPTWWGSAIIRRAFVRRQDRGSGSPYLTGKYIAFYATREQSDLLRLGALARDVSFQKYLRERLDVLGVEGERSKVVTEASDKICEAWIATQKDERNAEQPQDSLWDGFCITQIRVMKANGISNELINEVMLAVGYHWDGKRD